MAEWLILESFAGPVLPVGPGPTEAFAAAGTIIDDALIDKPALLAAGCPLVLWNPLTMTAARDAFLAKSPTSGGTPRPEANLLSFLVAFGVIGGSSGGDIKSDGSVPFAADESMGGHKLTNVANGVGPQDAATVNQATALAAAAQAAAQAASDPAGSAAAAQAAAIAYTNAAAAQVIYRWPEVDASDFAVVYKGAGITSVALSRVLDARQKALRVHYVATADDVFVIAITALTLPPLDAAKMRRFCFRMSIVDEPLGTPFGVASMAMGFGIGTKLAGAGHFSANVVMWGSGGSIAELVRIDAGVATVPGNTPAPGGCGNWNGAFTAGFMGSHVTLDSIWNEAEPGGGQKPHFGWTTRQEGNYQNPPTGSFSVDDAGIATAFASAFPASWNNLALTTLTIAFKSGAAGTYEVDLGDIEVLKHPMDLL